MSTPPRRHSAEYAQNALRATRTALGALGRVLGHYLDEQVFPRAEAYYRSRFNIVLLLVFFVVLMVTGDPAVQLKLGNYTNVGSALAGAIIMLMASRHHRETTSHHESHRATLTSLEHELQEVRRVLITQADTAEIPAVSNVVQMPDPATHKARRARSTRTGGRKRGDVNESE